MPRLVKVRIETELVSIFDQPFVCGRFDLGQSIGVLRGNRFSADIQVKRLAGSVCTEFGESSAAGVRLLPSELCLILWRTIRGDDPKKLLARCEFTLLSKLNTSLQVLSRRRKH